jgi:hypothetical protein
MTIGKHLLKANLDSSLSTGDSTIKNTNSSGIARRDGSAAVGQRTAPGTEEGTGTT